MGSIVLEIIIRFINLSLIIFIFYKCRYNFEVKQGLFGGTKEE